MSRADLHCHSSASAVSKLGVQRALGLPECATPPEEVYALAKRRGMDFVTITDHDTIAGVLEIADRPDVFVSEELTARFRGEPQAVHVLCLGITPDHHEWLQAHADDVETVAAYLHEHEIACALAHPFYAVDAPLTARHRRRLAELFPIWEVRNGARSRELNLPAAIYVDTHGSAGIGGSDDHAGIDIGRTWSETPSAATPEDFLAHVRAGRVGAFGDQGSAAKWAHAAMALAVRALGRGDDGAPPDPAAVLQIAERVMAEGDARSGPDGGGVGPERRPGAPARVAGRRRAGRRRARAARPTSRPRASRTPASSGARGAATSASWRPPSCSRAPRRRTARRRTGTPSPPACSRRAWRPSRTRPPPRSWRARRTACRSATTSRSASRWSPTASAPCTASPARSPRSASAACPGSRSR